MRGIAHLPGERAGPVTSLLVTLSVSGVPFCSDAGMQAVSRIAGNGAEEKALPPGVPDQPHSRRRCPPCRGHCGAGDASDLQTETRRRVAVDIAGLQARRDCRRPAGGHGPAAVSKAATRASVISASE